MKALFRKALILSFIIFSFVFLANFFSSKASADSCNDYTGPNGTTVHQSCISKSSVLTSCGTNGLWASNGSGTCTTAGEICGVCGQGPASSGTLNSGTCAYNGQSPDSTHTCCAGTVDCNCPVGATCIHVCSTGSTPIDCRVLSSTGQTGSGGTSESSTGTSTSTDRVEGKVIIQQNNNSNTTSSCAIEIFGVCFGGSSSSNGLKGATITIDSNITVTTDTQGEFEKNVPHVDTHTVALTVPEGYQLVSPTSATQTFGTTGSNWKTKLRDVEFTLKQSDGTTTTPICDPNGDGTTDTKDLTIIENEWYGTATTKTGDCNKDGVVNGLDFQMWKDISVIKLNNTTLY